MWMPAGLQTNHGSSNVHAWWFSCWKIGVDNCDIMIWCHKDLSCWKREGTIKGEHDQILGLLLILSSGCYGTQTLYIGCLGALQGGSITRMNIAAYLSICMHPDFSGGLSVSMTLVVWWQPGRSLPSPLEPGIEWSTDHNPLVANCQGRINH